MIQKLMALARYISINLFTSALSRLNQKNPNIKSVQANLLTNLEIIILLLLTLFCLLLIALTTLNARMNYPGLLTVVLNFLFVLSAALSLGCTYYILIFILLSLSDLYFAAEYYLLYLILSFMICIGILVAAIGEGVGSIYSIMSGSFITFLGKVDGLARKAFCITDKQIEDDFTPEFNYNIGDISSPYALGPKRK